MVNPQHDINLDNAFDKTVETKNRAIGEFNVALDEFDIEKEQSSLVSNLFRNLFG